MELKLVSFETAKKLKEIGFDIKVTDHYRFGGNYKIVGLLHGGSLYNMNCKDEQLLWSCGLYSAPTLALAQMWFRENHNIDIEPEKWKPQRYEGYIYSNSGRKQYYSNKGESIFNSYDEALEAGILECIKLIKTKQDD